MDEVSVEIGRDGAENHEATVPTSPLYVDSVKVIQIFFDSIGNFADFQASD